MSAETSTSIACPPSLFPNLNMTSETPISAVPLLPSGSHTSAAPRITNRKVTLQVGERRFVTTRRTLEESPVISRLISEEWDNAEEDGSYFIDADPLLFEHILRYLRRRVLPLFFDKVKGHDYVMYLALLEDARYFLIQPLVDWIEGGGYLEAVQTVYDGREAGKDDSLERTMNSKVELQCFPTCITEKRYLCPRRIPVHYGKKAACGKDCKKAQGGHPDEYEDVSFWRTWVLQKQIVFDSGLCTGRG